MQETGSVFVFLTFTEPLSSSSCAYGAFWNDALIWQFRVEQFVWSSSGMQRSAVRLLHNAPSAFRRWSASWKRTQVPLSFSLRRRPLFLPNHIIIYKFFSALLAHLHFSLIWQDSTRTGLKVMGVLGCERDSNFHIHGSVHRHSKLIRSKKRQQYTGIHLLQTYSTCFGCLSTPSSGVHQTVTTASGTGRCPDTMTCTRSCIYSLMYSWWWVW